MHKNPEDCCLNAQHEDSEFLCFRSSGVQWTAEWEHILDEADDALVRTLNPSLNQVLGAMSSLLGRKRSTEPVLACFTGCDRDFVVFIQRTCRSFKKEVVVGIVPASIHCAEQLACTAPSIRRRVCLLRSGRASACDVRRAGIRRKILYVLQLLPWLSHQRTKVRQEALSTTAWSGFVWPHRRKFSGA